MELQVFDASFRWLRRAARPASGVLRMRHGGRWWWLLAFLWGSKAMAALAITGEVLIEPSASTLRRGDFATITYTITNIGDETLDFAGMGTTFVQSGPSSTIFPSATAATAPCTFQLLDGSPPPGQSAIVVNSVGFRPNPIAPGASRQCVTGLQVSSTAAGPFAQSFTIGGTRGGQTVSVQRIIAFGLGANPGAVPAVSTWGVALLAGILVLVGHRRFHSIGLGST